MTKKTRHVSFNAMVKFFLENYNIPTRKDFDKIITRLDRIEKLAKTMSPPGPSRRFRAGKPRETASSAVLEVIKEHREGVDFAEILNQTGFNDKKIRNIIFRLDKIGKIERIRRGVYIAS